MYTQGVWILSRQEDKRTWVFPQATPNNVRECARDSKVKTKLPLVKETEENPFPISSQYRTEWYFSTQACQFCVLIMRNDS